MFENKSGRMSKIIKWIGIVLGSLLVIGVVVVALLSEKKPDGQPSAAADEMAQQMLKAIDKAAWDSTGIVAWTFAGRNHFIWDKAQHLVAVEWGKHLVLLNPNTISGKAFVKGVEQSGKRADKLVRTAWSSFCNDSFWLNAPSKVLDAGTERSIVTLKDGRQGLMVTYTSGGVTPGDSYVWILDESGLPIAWKMWVKIIPIGGLESTWSDWAALTGGAKIATSHEIGGAKIKITNLKSANSYEELGKASPFVLYPEL